MVEQCCVDGCLSTKDDLQYFKLPVSRTLRKRWLDAMRSALRLADQAVVCSRHFREEQFMFVRGKRQLKPKVVPCVFGNIEEKAESKENETRCPQPIHCNTNGTDSGLDEGKTDKEGSIDKERDKKTTSPEGSRRTSPQKSMSPEGSRRNTPPKVKNPPYVEFSPNKDIEDILTNYHIKQTRPLFEISAERESAASGRGESGREEIRREENGRKEGGREESGAEEIRRGESGRKGSGRDEDRSEPTTLKYVEISVGGKNQDQSNEDCLMLLENVQVEIDPNLFPELDHDHDHDQTVEAVDLDHDSDSDCIDLGEKKEAPISLLSSSDEDEVIIQEPKIDTVEVSDATDEDDLPLLKLAKIRKKKSKKSPKKSQKSAAITKIVRGKYKCQFCLYRATGAADHAAHVSRHAPTRHACAVCSYTTSSALSMQRHREKHGRESKRDGAQKRFRCPLCSYRARHNMSLVYHMATHGVRARSPQRAGLACGHCAYSAADKGALRKHVKRWHGDENVDDGDYVPPAWA